MKYRLLTLTILFTVLPLITTAQTPRFARVISENANLRDMPNVSSTSILEAPEETLVKILDEKLPWYVVRIGNRVGWMHGDTLEFVSVSTPSQRLSEQSVTPDFTPSTSAVPSRSADSTTSPPASVYTPRSSSATSHYIRGPRGGCITSAPPAAKSTSTVVCAIDLASAKVVDTERR